jgi:hypothetical protein
MTTRKDKQAASALVVGKEVMLQTHGKDKYGRTPADVFLPDGTNVNHALVKDGWCWWYRKYAPVYTVLEGLEKGYERLRVDCGVIALGQREALLLTPVPLLSYGIPGGLR